MKNENSQEKIHVEQQPTKEIDLKELFILLKRYIWIIVGITVIATSIGAYYSYSTFTPIYQSSARIIIGADAETMKTLKVIIKDATVLDRVSKELGLNRSADSLSSQIMVENIESSQVVKISVIDSNPVTAAKIANTTIKVYQEEIVNIMDFSDVRILSEAVENEQAYPINETQNRTIFIAFFVGLVISVGFAFLLDSFDDSLRSEREIENLMGLPVLGSVSVMNKKNINKVKAKQENLEIRGESIGS
ncbi:YveK family protein [Metabacillus herbersteinensis]|uniref:YveK family protein n=1 Tax=Metabacillus herbersteinensis TaxID=283816 RepID=A0ABV6G931_9BACI